MNYVSTEIKAEQLTGGGFVLSRRDGTCETITLTHGIGRGACAFRVTDSWAIMLELTEDHRIALGLPPCEAVTGGTALCLAREDKIDVVPLPTAPTCWDELVSAELWPMSWLGQSGGLNVKIALSAEQ